MTSVTGSVGLAVVAVLALVACGDDSPEPAARPSATSAPPGRSTSTTPGPSPTTAPDGSRPPGTGPESATTVPNLPDGAVEQVIDGVTVRVRTRLGAIPDRATAIEHGGTLIDDGVGPMLCFGGVQESYPPQCDGPVVDVEMDDWATVEGDVAFGERTLVMAWPPPASGPIEVFGERPYEPAAGWPYPTPELPVECRGIDEFVPVEELAAYAAEHPGLTATPAVVDGGRIGVLQVVESAIDEVRSDLTSGAVEPCLQPVAYSTDQLLAAQDAIGAAWQREPDLYIASTGSGNAFNRVTVDVLVADGMTVSRLAELVDDPSILLVFGIAELVDGS